MIVIRKDVRTVAVGDQFRLCASAERREVVSVRQIEIAGVPHTEFLHGKVNHPGNLFYLQVPHGSQLAVLIP